MPEKLIILWFQGIFKHLTNARLYKFFLFILTFLEMCAIIYYVAIQLVHSRVATVEIDNHNLNYDLNNVGC